MPCSVALQFLACIHSGQGVHHTAYRSVVSSRSLQHAIIGCISRMTRHVYDIPSCRPRALIHRGRIYGETLLYQERKLTPHSSVRCIQRLHTELTHTCRGSGSSRRCIALKTLILKLSTMFFFSFYLSLVYPGPKELG